MASFASEGDEGSACFCSSSALGMWRGVLKEAEERRPTCMLYTNITVLHIRVGVRCVCVSVRKVISWCGRMPLYGQLGRTRQSQPPAEVQDLWQHRAESTRVKARGVGPTWRSVQAPRGRAATGPRGRSAGVRGRGGAGLRGGWGARARGPGAWGHSAHGAGGRRGAGAQGVEALPRATHEDGPSSPTCAGARRQDSLVSSRVVF